MSEMDEYIAWLRDKLAREHDVRRAERLRHALGLAENFRNDRGTA